jgi:hypothetical protein
MSLNQYRCNVRGLYLMDFLNYPPVNIAELGDPSNPFVHLMIIAQDRRYCTMDFNVRDRSAVPFFIVESNESLIKMEFASPFLDRNTSLRVIL